MSRLGALHGELDAQLHSNMPPESRNRELAELVRALAAIIATDGESPPSGNPVSFEDLAQSERLLTADFGAFRVGLCMLDTRFRYLAINQMLAKMNGIPPAEHLGKTVREVLGDFAELIEPQFERVLATGQPVLNLEISFMLHNRTEPGHWIEHYIPVKDRIGKVTKIGVVAVEITEQKRLEKSLHSVSQKLRHEKKRLEVMSEVSRVLATKFEVRQAFPEVSAHLRRVLHQEYAALALRDEKTGKLVRQAIDFPLGKSIRVGGEISTAGDPRRQALLEGTALIFGANEMRSFPPGTTDY